MKTLLAFIVALFSLTALGAPAFPPPVVRNFWDTNSNAREVVSAGTNVFVTFSTSGTDTRTYRVDVPLQTVLTNGLTGIGVTAGSNSITTTNGSVVTVYSITDTNIVRILAGAVAATNSVYASNVISGGTMTITGGLLASNTSLTGPQLYVGAGTVQIVNNTGYQPFSFDGTTALFRGNGNALTNLDATKLTGTVPLAQLPGVGVLSNANVWTGVNTFNTTTTNKGISYFGSAGAGAVRERPGGGAGAGRNDTTV